MTDYVAHNGAGLYVPRGATVGTDDRLAPHALLNEGAGYVSVALTERIAALEMMAEDSGWRREAAWTERDFSRQGLRYILEYARLMFLKNPLIQRAVSVQSYYVWGQGFDVRAPDDDVNDVIQAFMEDKDNQTELTSHQARVEKEKELTVTGNIFLVFFTQPSTGRVRVRSMPVDDVLNIITNPDDAKEPWYYERQWSQSTLDVLSGVTTDQVTTAYYPDWRYHPAMRPPQIGRFPVLWDNPVYHIKTGGLRDMRFGVPEVYAALDWAQAVKRDLEDYATVKRAHARFAWQMKTEGGAKGVAALKSKLNTTVGTGGPSIETNPPPLTGSTAIMGAGTTLSPIYTAGATPSPDEGRRLWLMVASATGFPETFFGEASVGAHATAKTLDRPTELKMRDRQVLWSDIFKDILQFVIEQNAQAPGSTLGATVTTDDDGRTVIDLGTDPATGELRTREVQVIFPPMLERDALQRVGAVVQAATLNGFPSAGTFDKRTIVQLLLQALGEDDIQEMLDRLAPQEDEPLMPPVPLASTLPAAAGLNHPADGSVSTSSSDSANRAPPTRTKPTVEAQRPPHQRPAWLDAQIDQAVRDVAHWQAKHATALTRRDG